MCDKALRHDHDDQHEPTEAPKRADSTDVTEDDVEESIDVEALLHRRPSRRKRAVQVGLALLCGLAVFGLFHAITPAATRTPAPAPLASKSRSQVTIAANLSFGSVTVDGKKLVGKPPFQFSAAPGGDLVMYSAPPFSPQACRVSWYGKGASVELGAAGSTCQITSETVRVSSWVTSSYVLTFQFGLGDLPAALQATALDVVRQVITPASLPLAVPRGQYYTTRRDSTGMILSRQATTPLTGIVSLLLPTPQDLATSTTWCSEPICPALSMSLVGAPTSIWVEQLWTVQIPLAVSWQYLLPDGQPVGAEQQSQVSSDMTVVLALEARQQWHLLHVMPYATLVDQQRQMIPNLLCSTGVTELSNALQNQQAGQLEVSVSIDHGLTGCEMHITHYDGTVVGRVVWRFGVLLAADAKTHMAYRWLPLAPKAEIAAVEGIING